MIRIVKLIINSFFNLKDGNEFVKNGKGIGNGILALIALVFCVVNLAGIATTDASFIFNKQEMKKVVKEAIKDVPPLIIKNGELQWEKDEIKTFKLDNDFSLTLDTINDDPSVSKLSKSEIYVTRKNIYVNDRSKNKIQPVSFEDIQTLFKTETVNLTSDENISTMIMFVQYVIWFALVFVILGVFFGFWIASVFLTFLTRVLGSTIDASIKAMDYSEARRMAAISATPVIIAMAASSLAFGQPDWWIRWGAIVIVGAIIMTARAKMMKEEK